MTDRFPCKQLVVVTAIPVLLPLLLVFLGSSSAAPVLQEKYIGCVLLTLSC